MKTLIIDRKKWGAGNEGGFLLRANNNKMCCLGFFAKECGYKTNDLREVGDLTGLFNKFDLKNPRQQKLSCLLTNNGMNNDICARLIETNDNTDLESDERENGIANLFSKINIKVKFIN